MENIIAVLPQQVANQIAAGEVIQQPASAVKELMENAVDAGATCIDVCVKEGGRFLIRVTDNGKGMSRDDAVLCFERHATSKLHQADDLFAIRTMGFRGEALASIAAIAQVELVTRREDDELGCRVCIAGSKQEAPESTVAEKGTRISVRNIFFNVPARRKFMGNPSKQLQAIRNEFIQIALAHPECRMSLSNDGNTVFQLHAGNLRQRILALFGETLNKRLYPIDVDTDVVRIHGFVADPEASRKRNAEQYFFVNSRFIRHPYFRKAIQSVYEPLVSEGMQPVFFLFLEAPADSIDVNISPTKTEVKFEHEQIIWPILSAAVKECLGKFNVFPSIDFDRTDAPVIDVYSPSHEVKVPEVRYNPQYNPFHPAKGWEKLYEENESVSDNRQDRFLEDKEPYITKEPASARVEETSDSTGEISVDEQEEALQTLFSADETPADYTGLFQLFARYIALPAGNSLLLIDQHRAEVRIHFEQYSRRLKQHRSASQALLFSEQMEIPPSRKNAFEQLRPLLEDLGFRFGGEGQDTMGGQNITEITGIPDFAQGIEPCRLVEDLMDSALEQSDPHSAPQMASLQELHYRMALKLARQTAVPYGRTLSNEAMTEICRSLFQQEVHRFTPDRKQIIMRLTAEELIRRFN